jgi:small-conductance mechanosensitive channel
MLATFNLLVCSSWCRVEIAPSAALANLTPLRQQLDAIPGRNDTRYIGTMDSILANWQNWAWSIGVSAIAAVVGLIIYSISFAAARRFTKRTRTAIDQSVVSYASRPSKLIFPIVAIFVVVPGLPLTPEFRASYRHLLALILIGAVAWLVTSLMNVVDDLFAIRYKPELQASIAARRVKTQVQVLRRLGVILVAFVAFAAMLMTFPTIWNIGAGLFASAGAAGLVIGMAARPALSNLLAGVQIALTEPIRLDDVVVVEGEFGRVEEIQTTYVVVRLWDLRRLVLPLSYFIEKPFQNWTRSSSNILGTVFLYVDYRVPVEELREQLMSILRASGMWDGVTAGLQVTDATDRSLQLRALMSASDSGKAWDLRCLVREKMIAYLQAHYPESLPRSRAEIAGAVTAAG